MAIQLCLDGLKGWKLSLKSTGFFSCKTTANLSMGNARISNVPKEQWTAVAIASFSINQTSPMWNLILRKSSQCMDTSATCNRNSIVEQYWGAVKLLYMSRPWLKKMDKIEKQVVACLDDIPLLQIWGYGFWNYIQSNRWLTVSDQSGLLINLCISWIHIGRALMVLKRSGPIESTMAIKCYQTTSWKH